MQTEYKLSEYIIEYENNIELYRLILEKYPDAIYNSYHGKFMSEKVNYNFSNHRFFTERAHLCLELYNVETLNNKCIFIYSAPFILEMAHESNEGIYFSPIEEELQKHIFSSILKEYACAVSDFIKRYKEEYREDPILFNMNPKFKKLLPFV
jgi:hypothetical protein